MAIPSLSMRGFPLINTFVIAVALGLILVPLLRLTSSTDTVSPDDLPLTEESGMELTPVAVSLRYTHLPETLTLTHLGRVLWRADSVTALEEGREFSLAIPEEGIDLLVEVVWPEGTPLSALEITLEPEAHEERVQVLWGEGVSEDVLSFVWREMDS